MRKNTSPDASIFKGLLDRSRDVIYRLELIPERKYAYISPSVKAISGYSDKDFYSDSFLFLRLIPGEDREAAIKIPQINETGFITHRIRNREGEIRWIERNETYLKDSEGTIYAIEGMIRDITPLKQAGEEIRRREELYREIVEHQNELVVKVDTQGRFLYVSPSYCKLFGKTEEDLKGKKFVPLIHKDDREATLQAMKNLYQPPYQCYVEQRARTVMGWRWLAWQDTAIRDASGQVVAILGVGRDITDKKQFEQALQESEQRYRQLTENTLAGIYIIQNGVIRFCNLGFCQIFGYPYAEMILGKKVLDFVHPDHRELVARELQAREDGVKEVSRYEFDALKADGTVIPVEVLGVRTMYEGKPAVQGVILDISDRKKVLTELAKSEDKFRKAFHTSPDSININRLRDGMYVDINSGFTRITGFTRKDVIGKTSLEINIWANPKDRDRLVKGLQEKGHVENLEAVFRMKDGTLVRGLMSASVIELNGEPHIISITRSIEDRKRLEEALEIQRNQLQMIFETAGEVLFLLQVEPNDRYRFISVNTQFLKATGLKREQVEGKEVREVIPEPSLSLVLGKYKEAIKSRQTVRWEEVTPYPKGLKTGMVSVSPAFDTHGKCTHLVGSVLDITERIFAENQLRLVSGVVETTSQAALISDISGKIIYVNPGLIKMAGLKDTSAVLERSIFEFTDEEGRRKLKEEIIPALLKKGHWHGEIYNLKADGSFYPAEENCSVIRDEQGNPEYFVAVFSDITERKKAEIEIIRQRRQIQNLINNLQGLVYRCRNDREWTMVFLSQGCYKLTGYKPAELLNNRVVAFNDLIVEEDRERVWEEVQKALEKKKPYRLKYRIRHKKGKIKYVHETGVGIFENGQVVSLEGIITDVTRQEESRQALQAETIRTRKILASTLDGYILADTEGKILDVNPAYCKITGYSRRSLLKMNIRDLEAQLSPEEVRRRIQQFTQKGQDRFETMHYHKNGTPVHLDVSISVMESWPDQKPLVTAFVRDITDYHKALERLKLSEERFRTVVENAQEGIVLIDDAFQFEYVNPAFYRMLHYKPAELAGTDFRLLLPDDYREVVADRYVRRQRGEKVPSNYDLALKRRDNSLLQAHMSVSVFTDPTGRKKTVALLLDLTDRVMMEQQLKESEQRFRTLFNEAPDAYYLMDTDGTFRDGNQAAERISGYKKEELIGKKFAETGLINKNEKRAMLALLNDIINKNNEGPVEIPLRRKNGEQVTLEVHPSLIELKGQKQILGVARDITWRRKSEEQIRLQSAAMDNAANSIVITGPDGTIEYVNRAFTQITGYSRDEAIGQNPRILKSEMHDTPFYKNLWDTILGGREWRDKIINKNKEGRLITVDMTIAPLRDPDGNTSHFVAIQADITREEATRKKLQETLHRLHGLSEHLNDIVESERQSIARNLHDNLGQILTAVKMDLSWLNRKMSPKLPETTNRLKETKTLVDDAMDTVRQITSELRPSILDELGWVAAVEALCIETEQRSGISFDLSTMQPDLHLPERLVLPVYRVIQEAITNIVRHSDATEAYIRVIRGGGYYIFSVIDNGVGISEEAISSSRSFGIVGMQERIELLGGTFSIKSRDRGTEVLFKLPVKISHNHDRDTDRR